MPFCPKCFLDFLPDACACPFCNESLIYPVSNDPERHRPYDIVEIYRAPDEMTGIAVRDFLEQAGIPAVLQDMHASFYSNVLDRIQGYWGKVLVLREQEMQARKLLEDFLHHQTEI